MLSVGGCIMDQCVKARENFLMTACLRPQRSFSPREFYSSVSGNSFPIVKIFKLGALEIKNFFEMYILDSFCKCHDSVECISRCASALEVTDFSFF